MNLIDCKILDIYGLVHYQEIWFTSFHKYLVQSSDIMVLVVQSSEFTNNCLGSQGAKAPLMCSSWTSSTFVLRKTYTCPIGFNLASCTARDQLETGVRCPGRRLVKISRRDFATSAYCLSLSPLSIPGWYKGGGTQSFVTA